MPLISYQIQETVKIPARIAYEETSSIPLVMNSSEPLISKNPIEEPFDWSLVLQGIYVLGILFMLIKFSIIIYKLLKIKRLSTESDFISTKSQYANSSFFNLIFIDDSNLSENEINQILEHEKWHIRLFHSYDLLFVEILKIIFWFNPILWLYQRSLAEVHEYEVDTRMIQTYNPQTYALLLLKLASSISPLAATHQFSRKPLTDRIHFLFTKQKSVPMKRLAYLSVLPIVGAFFMAFSVERVVDYQVEDKPDEKYFKIVKGEFPKESYPIKVIDKKVISTINLSKNKIGAILTSFNINKQAIEEAAKYFDSYGFKLDLAYKTEDLKSKGYEKLEVRLTEHKDKSKLRILNGKSSKRNEGVNKDALLEIMRSKFDGKQGNIVLIIADKSTGKRTIDILMPPPPPPVPPKPPVPPVPPVKVGMINIYKDYNSIFINYPNKEINNFSNIYMIFNNNKDDFFVGRKIGNGKFLSEVVTQKDWQGFLDFINSDNYFSNTFRKQMIPDNWNKIKVKSNQIPVTFISADQANEYCKWQSEMIRNSIPESKNPDYQAIITSNTKTKLRFSIRLPTENEWKIASNRKMLNDNTNEIGFCCILEMLSI